MTRQLCQPAASPEKSIAAERERNRRFWEGKAYTPQSLRITNATMPADAPWALFTPPAREDGEHHRRYPSRFGERSVYLHEWGGWKCLNIQKGTIGRKSKTNILQITMHAKPSKRWARPWA